MSISPTLTSRWRSGKHVGAARPTQIVTLEPGRIDHKYAEFVKLDGSKPEFGYIAGSDHNAHPWQAYWHAHGDEIVLPNVSNVSFDGAIDAGTGLGEPVAATVIIENVIFGEVNGAAGIYHAIQRGYMAPWMGYQGPNRHKDDDAAKNHWYNVLNGSFRIKVSQGYGDVMVPVFTGLIDDTDVHSSPDTVTITSRDFGCLLTDQRVFGWNKAKEIRVPVVFADRRGASKHTKEGANADASSTDPRHSYQNVLKPGSDRYWLSDGHSTENVTEWIEVHLPKGRYTEFYVAPEYDDMEMFVSIYCHSNGLPGGCSIDGTDVPDGWVNTGLGSVPGTHGGFPYVKHYDSVASGGRVRQLPFALHCGDGTALRISFRRLGFSTGKGDYRAKVSRLIGYRQTIDEAALRIKHWVLVDDPSDIVRWVLMWQGFKEWEVQDFGVRLKSPVTFHQGDYMVDIIKYVLSQSDAFVFFVDRPSSHPDSLGVPRFVKSRSVKPAQSGIQEVRDTDLLTGVETKFSKESLSYNIRVRGKPLSRKKGGRQLGEDHDNRVMALYFPPWSGRHRGTSGTVLDWEGNPMPGGRLAGFRRHEVRFDPGVSSNDEAMMFCLLIALAEAVVSYQGTIEVPGYPFSLNDQISIVDTPSGTNTRMWIMRYSSSMTTGEQAEFKTTLSGALIDTPDILAIAMDYLILLKKVANSE